MVHVYCNAVASLLTMEQNAMLTYMSSDGPVSLHICVFYPESSLLPVIFNTRSIYLDKVSHQIALLDDYACFSKE